MTRSGYYIRKYKLDELPQLINVFTGDMSLVGPRPEVRKYVDLYTPEQMHVLDVRPGITDPASIRYRNENELLAQVEDPDRYYVEVIMQDKLQLNLEYVEKQSFRFDLQLISKHSQKSYANDLLLQALKYSHIEAVVYIASGCAMA